MSQGPRLHVVTGKGGTGKTTAAVALALALARTGKKVLVCEIEERQGISQALDVPPLSPKERLVATCENGGEVHGVSVEAKAALLEYLRMFYRLGAAGAVLDRIGAVDFATTMAPGVRDVLLIGKVYEATVRRVGGGLGRTDKPFAYDAVVLDAPPTGRVGHVLGVNTQVASLAKVGPIHRQATAIAELLASPATCVHVVTLLEPMPVQESLDAIEGLGADGIRVGSVLVNKAPTGSDDGQPPAVLPDAARVEQVLAQAGLDRGSALAEALVAQGRDWVAATRDAAAQRERLEATGVPLCDLPWQAQGVDPAAVRALSHALAQVVAHD